MASSLSTRPAEGWAVGHPRATAWTLWALAPVGLVVLLLQLVLSDGGRDAATLTLVQTCIFAVVALLALTGSVRWHGVSRAAALVIAVVAGSVLWSVRPEATVRELLLWMMYAGITIVIASTLSGATAARRVVDGIVIVAGWTCLVALFNHWGAGNPAMRWSSTFYWPNPFAGFLLLVVPLELIRTVAAPTRRDALAHGAMTTLLILSVVLTYSRGAWAALVIALALGAIVFRPPSWRAAVWRGMILAAAVAIAVVLLTANKPQAQSSTGLAARAASIADTGDTSIQGRLSFWRAGWRIFRDHPLGGTGAGTFAAVHPQYQQDVRFYARDVHSVYVQTLAELGLVGAIVLAILLGAFYRVWRTALRSVRNTSERAVVAGIGLGLVAFFAHSGIEMNWSFPAGPAVAFALLGVVAAYAAPSSPPTVAGRQRWGPAVVVSLLAILAVQVWRAAQNDYVSGLAAMRAGRPADALERFTHAAQWNPLQPRYQAGVARAAVVLVPPDVDLALASLRRAERLDPQNASHPYQLAGLLILYRRGPSAWEEAETLLQQTVRLDPMNWPEAYRTLARLYVDVGRRADAAAVYAAAVNRYRSPALAGSIMHVLLWPEVVGLTRDWAAFLAADGRTGDAISVLENITAADPRLVLASLDLARLYRRDGRPHDANAVLARILEAAPANEAAWLAWRLRQGRPLSPYER